MYPLKIIIACTSKILMRQHDSSSKEQKSEHIREMKTVGLQEIVEWLKRRPVSGHLLAVPLLEKCLP